MANGITTEKYIDMVKEEMDKDIKRLEDKIDDLVKVVGKLTIGIVTLKTKVAIYTAVITFGVTILLNIAIRVIF